jgi:hypothetical protein
MAHLLQFLNSVDIPYLKYITCTETEQQNLQYMQAE